MYFLQFIQQTKPRNRTLHIFKEYLHGVHLMTWSSGSDRVAHPLLLTVSVIRKALIIISSVFCGKFFNMYTLTLIVTCITSCTHHSVWHWTNRFFKAGSKFERGIWVAICLLQILINYSSDVSAKHIIDVHKQHLHSYVVIDWLAVLHLSFCSLLVRPSVGDDDHDITGLSHVDDMSGCGW